MFYCIKQVQKTAAVAQHPCHKIGKSSKLRASKVVFISQTLRFSQLLKQAADKQEGQVGRERKVRKAS